VSAAQAKIIAIHKQLAAGSKFDELARKESNGPTAEQGGDLGYFKRGDLAKTLEDETFKLKAGEYTPPIHTRQGFVILMVNDHIEAGTPPFERVREQIQERLYMERIQPALREYLVKLREDAYINVKPGYTDTGASASGSKLIYATDAGPRTKQVRGKLGMGKKKTVLAERNEKTERSEATAGSDNVSEPGQAKAEPEAREKAVQAPKSVEDPAAAKAAAEAAEQEKMSHMSNNEKKRYLAQKKKREEKEAKGEAKQKVKEERKQKELAAKDQRKTAEAKAAQTKKPSAKKPAQETKSAKNKKPAGGQKTAKNKKPEKKSKEAASEKTSGKTDEEAKSGEQADSSGTQAADSQPQEKKKIHWF
jgi:peptidyl-prolyl cis-trans isomerase SurA